jgi:16S rRNA C967 or C1407 C5-methylase (RsmB/RsmF family)
MSTPPPSSNLPQEKGHHELRAHLAELYWRVITRPIPPDQVLSFYFRHSKDLAQKARGFLAAALYDLLRERMRLHALLEDRHLHHLSIKDQMEKNQCIADPRLQRRAPYVPWNGCIPLPRLRAEEETIAALSFWLWRQYGAFISEQKSLFAILIDHWRNLPILQDETRRFPNPHLIEPLLFASIPGSLKEPLQTVFGSGLTADVARRWQSRFGSEEFELLIREFNRPAPLDLRINTHKMSREQALELFAKNEIKAEATPLSPDGLRLQQKMNVFKLEAFEEGCFEVQDAGSQLVGFACNAKPTWKVLDACSGAGGKSLHLSALMKNRGEIYAHDQEDERLQSQKKRLRRSNCQNVRLVEPGTAAEHAPYDLVLVDAPCLGFGTLRRNPDFLWRSPLEVRLSEIAALQNLCLDQYAPLVKPGGIFVYVTCSFEPEETIDLLSQHPLIQQDFTRDPLLPQFQYHGIKVSGLAPGANHLTLLPHQHQTDGFFIARYRRKG